VAEAQERYRVVRRPAAADPRRPWPILAPGGLLLYATCSLFTAENELQISEFQKEHPEALRETISYPANIPHAGAQLLPSGNGTGHNQDGFFYGLLRKV